MVLAPRPPAGSPLTPSSVHAALRLRLSEVRRALLAPDAASDKQIHAARKSLKRTRASLRLLRAVIPKSAYSRENGSLKGVARPLARVRDADVALRVFERLCAKNAFSTQGREVRTLRRALVESRISARRQLESDDVLRHCADELEKTILRMEKWRFRRDDPQLIAAGLKRLYRRGRKTYVAVHATDGDLNLHECRRQSKYLWYAMEMLPSGKGDFVAKQIRYAKAGGDLLGDDRDMLLLSEFAVRQSRAPSGLRTRLNLAIGKARQKLQRNALRQLQRLYRSKSTQFVKRALGG